MLALAEMDAVYRLAYHLARRPGEADDLVQETYLRAFKSAATYRSTERGVRPWLFKILHNVLNNRSAREQRQRSLVEQLRHEGPDDSDAVEPSGGAVPGLADLDWDRVDERLKDAIQALSPAHRTAFLLCAVERLTYQEIADVTEVPIGTVMSRLHRARSQLAARLAPLGAERGLAPAAEARKLGEGLIRPSPG